MAQKNIDTIKNIPTISVDNDNIIFTKTEIEAKFSGDEIAWKNYLQKNIKNNIPIINGARKGKYIVVIRFIVFRNGLIKNVVAETNNGFGMEEEAIRIITEGPNWIPGIQNGNKVNSYRRQPITFVVE